MLTQDQIIDVPFGEQQDFLSFVSELDGRIAMTLLVYMDAVGGTGGGVTKCRPFANDNELNKWLATANPRCMHVITVMTVTALRTPRLALLPDAAQP